MSAEFSPRNPWRPADWRWQLAMLLAEMPRLERAQKLRRRADRYLPRAVRLATDILEYEQIDDESLDFRHRDAYWAFRIYRDVERHYRAELEARILADETVDDIAFKMGLDKDTIRAFESIFFDVRVKLSSRSYVLHVILGNSLHRGLTERDFGTIWRFLGFCYGGPMLDAYMAQVVSPHRLRGPEDVLPAMDEISKASICRKSMIATMTIPVNTFTQVDLLNVYAKLLEVDKKAGNGGGGGGAGGTLLANVNAMLQSLPMAIGQFAQIPIDSHILSSYDCGSSELPTHHLMLAAQNRLEEGAVPQDLKYPEPTNHARIEQASGT